MSFVPPWSDGAFSSRALPQVQGSLTLNQVKDIEDEVETYLAWQEEKAELDAQTPQKQPSATLLTVTSGAASGVHNGPTRRTRDKCDYAPTRARFGKKGPSSASVGALDKAAKEKLVADVMETSDMDNLVIMQKLKDRLAAAGVQQPGVEVCFKDVTASVKVFTGSRSLPTLPNAALTMLENVFAPILKLLGPKEGSSKTLVMLDNVSGVLKPGRLTLLLGPPGAGKTTLMRVLAGQMKDKAVKVEGSVTYNGKHLNEFVVERTAAYVDQVDKHIGEMTVRETTAFSARMTGQGYDADPMWPLVKAKEQALGISPDPKLDELATHISSNREGDNIMVEIIGKILGLDICMDTVVGNDLLKGISGGQKKRVTTAEMAVGRFPLMLMDEISTGLDSASTYLITKSLKNLCTYLRVNIVVALLQPSPEVYDIFDDIMLMGDGRILYHGPREEILPFFSTLGLECPKRKGVADFLQEVTSVKDQPQYFADKSVPHSFISTAAVAASFKSSAQGTLRSAEVGEHGTKAFTELDMIKLVKKRYALHVPDILRCILARELLLINRMKAFVIVRAVQCVIIAVLVGTSFLQQSKADLNDANYFMSVAFFSLMFMLLGGFAEVPIFIQRLPVFYKQRDYKFYPAWAYCLGGAIVRIPDNVLMATLWTVLVYWLVGFYASAGQFFIFYLIMTSMSIFSTAIFRTIAAFCRDETVAQAMGAVVLVLTINTCGFTITRVSIPDWWIWMYWISPLAYAIRALLVNEMNTPDWSTPVVTGPGQTTSLGLFALEVRGFQTQTWWVWVGVGVLLGAAIALTALQAWLISVMDARKEGGSAVLEEEPEAAGGTELQPPAGPRGPPAVVSAASVTMTLTVDQEQGQGQGQDLEAGKGGAGGAKGKETALEFVPFSLAFRKIKYYVPKPGGKAGEELCLLQGIDGCFRPGVLTALMGASGAGKTTLMDVLAGRKTGGRMEGEQLLNGHTKVQATFSRVMGYVEQFDIHSPQQTVLEALLFSGRVRLPQDMARDKTDKFIGEVMDLVELHPLAHALIGLPGVYGLSVEQRKRLTIAVELVANPSVVFMDEPTSGLDARAAAIVMRVVRNTVNTGRTVVCTIHQPSLDIFQAFDELLLLKRGGETIFFGAMGGEQEHLIAHLESVQGVAKFQAGYNPANWMLEVTAPGAEKALGVDFARLYLDSPLNARNQQLLDKVCALPPGTVPLAFDTPFAVSTMAQFRLILHRNFVTYWRSPNYNLIRGLITIFVGLVFGSLYWDIGMQRSTVIEVLNIMGAIYSSSVFLGISNCMTVLPVIQNERVVYYREKASGMYSALPYAVAQGLVELPYLVCQSIVYCLIIYWMIGFEADVVKFFWFLLFLFLNFCVLTYFGIMAINLTPAVQFGTVFVAFFFTLWNFFCGFLQTKTDIPNYWVWMYYWQPLSWSIYGLVASQLGDVTDTSINVALPPAQPEWVTVSQYMQDQYGYRHDFIGWIVLILGGFIIVFRSAAAVALLKLNFQKR